MAKFTPFLGSISGKLNATVFAFNRAGFYIRAFRMPVNPSTTAQLTNRGIFAAAVTSWHTLTDHYKGLWNTYASAFFKSKNPVTGMNYTGYNSYVSLKNAADNLFLKAQDATITAPADATFTPGEYASSFNPPASAQQSTILDFQSNVLGLVFNNVSYSIGDAELTVDFTLIGNGGAGIGEVGPSFVTGVEDEKVGIAFYGSLPGTQNNQFVNNPELHLITATKPIGLLEDWTTATNLAFTIPLCPQTTDRKLGYAEQDLIQIKAFLVSARGAMAYIGAAKTRVSA